VFGRVSQTDHNDLWCERFDVSWWVGEKKARAGLWGIYRCQSGGARSTSSYRHFILIDEDDDPKMPPIAPQGLMLWTLVWVPMSADADRRRIDLALDSRSHIRTVIPFHPTAAQDCIECIVTDFSRTHLNTTVRPLGSK